MRKLSQPAFGPPRRLGSMLVKTLILVALVTALGSAWPGLSDELAREHPTSTIDAHETTGNRLQRLVDGQSFGGGLGVNIHFSGHHPEDVARIARSGFRLVRSDLLWAHVEVARGQYDWQQYDSLVKDLEANHLVPILILAYSNPLYAPKSVHQPVTDSLGYLAPTQGVARAAYMAFVRAAASHYGAHVIWEVWNEPDHNFGNPVDLRRFIGFAMEACQSVRGASPDAAVIGPAASGFVWWFLRAFQQADRAGCFDGISVHPYRDGAPESVTRDWARAQEMVADRASGEASHALVDSEWGYSATGGSWTAPRQAAFDTRLRLLDMMAGVTLTIIYDWRNDGPDPADKEANFGLLDYHGSEKPALRALSAMNETLSDLHLIRATTGASGSFALVFGRDGSMRKVVTWSSNMDGGAAPSSCAKHNHSEMGQNRFTVMNRNGDTVAAADAAACLSSMPRAIDIDSTAAVRDSRTPDQQQ